MPAFNAEKTISDAIESIIRQTFSDWELIIIDDNSKDETLKIVDKYCKADGRINLKKLSNNSGPAKARNYGLQNAKGAFIAFLDADDLWHIDKLNIQYHYHLDNPSIKISHTEFNLFNDKGFFKKRFDLFFEPVKSKQGNICHSLFYKNPVGMLTVMISSELIKEVGVFDESIWGLEDQDLWIRIAKAGYDFGYTNSVLAHYRVSETGVSKTIGRYKRNYKLFLKKIYKENSLDGDRLYRYYYRHFGTVYLKKGEFYISQLYFWKSIKCIPYDFVAFTTILYSFYGLINQLISMITKKRVKE